MKLEKRAEQVLSGIETRGWGETEGLGGRGEK
jgi:hypothetical protein